jgi:integrase
MMPTRDEIKAVIAALEGQWRPILLTAIFTGLRASELRGLRWKDVDFVNRELHVTQRADKYKELGAPKSASSARTVPLPPIVLNALRELKLASTGELVFMSPRGEILALSSVVTLGWWPAQVAAGVVGTDGGPKYKGLHSLRHFYASWCINRKADGGLELPLKMVQGRLGHSTLSMTADVYGHLFPAEDAADQVAEAERSLLG